MERPIVTLTDAGYTDLIEALEGSDAYSYVFDGQLGYLDYALANDALTPQVTGVDEWHINADEVSVYDYNDDVLDSGEQSFERVSETPATYAPDPYRASDHDPVIVGLALTVPEPSYACGADTFTVSELEALGFNVVVGTDAGEVLWGTRGNDAILALGGNDIVLADRGDDLVCGGDGRDTLVGGRGADDLRGEGDPDLLLGDRDNDTLDGGVGFDLGLGGRGHDECISVEFSIGCETRRR
jgi:Ca2+-binding RTX toxin-like protein